MYFFKAAVCFSFRKNQFKTKDFVFFSWMFFSDALMAVSFARSEFKISILVVQSIQGARKYLYECFQNCTDI